MGYASEGLKLCTVALPLGRIHYTIVSGTYDVACNFVVIKATTRLHLVSIRFSSLHDKKSAVLGQAAKDAWPGCL